jgi:hypothetical protein
MFFYTIINLFITFLKNVNKSCTSAGSLTLTYKLFNPYRFDSPVYVGRTKNHVVSIPLLLCIVPLGTLLDRLAVTVT